MIEETQLEQDSFTQLYGQGVPVDTSTSTVITFEEELKKPPVRPELRVIYVADLSLQRARRQLQAAVDQARAAGVSWNDIGDALGIRGTTAYQRFTEKGRESQREKAKRRREA